MSKCRCTVSAIPYFVSVDVVPLVGVPRDAAPVVPRERTSPSQLLRAAPCWWLLPALATGPSYPRSALLHNPITIVSTVGGTLMSQHVVPLLRVHVRFD